MELGFWPGVGAFALKVCVTMIREGGSGPDEKPLVYEDSVKG